MPFREPPPRVLERLVVGTNPAARMEISRRDSVKVGEAFELRLRVFDSEGQAIDGAPVQVRYEDGASNYLTTATGTLRLELKVPDRDRSWRASGSSRIR